MLLKSTDDVLDTGVECVKAILTGSSGFIGKHILQKLHKLDYDVIEVSRSNGFNFNDMTHNTDWLPHLEDVDIVINCVGIIVERKNQSFNSLHSLAPIALFDACAQAGVSRVIQVSALGADEEAFTSYQLSKKAADDELRTKSLDWFILRPSLVYGEEGISTVFFKKIARLPIVPLMGGGKQYIQPVHIMDLVDVVVSCLTSKSTKQTVDVVGPKAMTLAEWLQILRDQDGGGKIKIISIPYMLIRTASYLFQFIQPLFCPDNLRMLQKGNTSNNKQIIKLLGRKLRDLP